MVVDAKQEHVLFEEKEVFGDLSRESQKDVSEGVQNKEEKEESSKSEEVVSKEKEFEEFHDFDTSFCKEVPSKQKKDEDVHHSESLFEVVQSDEGYQYA